MRIIRAIAGRRPAVSTAGVAGRLRACTAILVLMASGAASAGAVSPPRIEAPAAARPVAVFGADDRVLLPQQLRALQERVGLLVNQRARSVCTAFCVAPDVVVTAAHCLNGGTGAPPRLAEFSFAPNVEQRRPSSRIAGAAAGRAEQFVLFGAAALSVRPPIDATKDWALVRLEQPVCSRGVLPVRAVPTEQILLDAAQGSVFQIAYHRDFQPWRLAYSKPCAVQRSFEGSDWSAIAQDFSDAPNLLLHHCDTGGASSGSPLLRTGPDGPEVVGINIGTYEEAKVEVESGRVVKRGKSTRVANTGINAQVFAAKLDLFRHAVIVTAPQQIRTLQAGLKQRGHYAGPVNGLYAAELRTAIETYERSQGLIVTGLATQALLKRLQGPAAVLRAPPRAG